MKIRFSYMFLGGLCLVLWLAGQTIAAPGLGRIVAASLNVRHGPDAESAVVDVLPKGQTVEIMEIIGGEGGWLKIRFERRMGYIRNRPIYVHLEARPTPEGESAARKQIQAQIQAGEEKIQGFSQKEILLVEQLDSVDRDLSLTRAQLTTLKKEHQAAGRKVEETQARTRALSQKIEKGQAYAGQRLKALYQARLMGRLNMGGSSASIFDFMLQQHALGRILDADIELIRAQTRDLDALASLENQLTREVERRSALVEEQQKLLRKKAQESRLKQRLLKTVQQEKQTTEALVFRLRESARKLDQQTRFAPAALSAPSPGSRFEAWKGKLTPPVKGKVVSRFGQRKPGPYNSFTFQSGIDIKIERGEPVRSVFKGEVIYSDWLLGYGNLIIIHHGDNYYSLYAHVQHVFKKKGDSVDIGETIATAGDTGFLKGTCLHFEIRHHGKAVNPLEWLKIGV